MAHTHVKIAKAHKKAYIITVSSGVLSPKALVSAFTQFNNAKNDTI
jgi:hypothetical protein